MKIRLLAIFMCILIGAPFFAQAGKTTFNGSIENVDIESYPKKLKDFLKDAKAIAKIKSLKDFLSAKLFEEGASNLESKTKITLEPLSAAFFFAKVVEQIKTKDLRQNLFLSNPYLLVLDLKSTPELDKALYQSYQVCFDPKNKDNLVRLLVQALGTDELQSRELEALAFLQGALASEAPLASPAATLMASASASGAPKSPDNSDMRQYIGPNPRLSAKYVLTYLMRSANDFTDLLKKIDTLSVSIDKLNPPNTQDNMEFDREFEESGSPVQRPVPVSSSMSLLTKILAMSSEYKVDFAKEKFDSRKFYEFILQLNPREQYASIEKNFLTFLKFDEENFAEYLNKLSVKDFNSARPMNLAELLIDDNINRNFYGSENLRSEEFINNFTKEIDLLARVYFPSMNTTELSSLYNHYTILEQLFNKGYSDQLKKLKMDKLVDMGDFINFTKIYYVSDIYKKYPVAKMTKESMQTLILFFDTQNQNYVTKFVNFINSFDKPLFRDSLSWLSEEQFAYLYSTKVRDEVFTEEQLNSLRRKALDSENESPAKEKAKQAMMSELKKTAYNFRKVPTFYAELIFKDSELFKSIPNGIVIQNYEGNFGEGIEALVSSKKITFAFSKDVFSLDSVFDFDSYKSYQDTLNLDDFAKAFMHSIENGSKVPDLVSTSQFQKNETELMAKFYARLSEYDRGIKSILSRISDENFRVLEPLFLSRISANETLLPSLILWHEGKTLDRGFELLTKVQGPIGESDFAISFYSLMAKSYLIGLSGDLPPSKCFDILASKAPKLNLAELFRFDSYFQEYLMHFLTALDYDSKLLKQLDTWSLDWKKLLDYVANSGYMDAAETKKFKELLTKNKIDFKKARALSKIDDKTGYEKDFYNTWIYDIGSFGEK